MNLCDYGCGKEAKYQFKNGKYCCCDHYMKCENVKKNSKGRKHTKETKLKISLRNKHRKHTKESKEKMRISHRNISEETRQKMTMAKLGKKRIFSDKHKKNLSISKKGKNNPMYGKNHSKEHKRNQSISQRYTINDYKKKHNFFYIVEEMRYNPNKPGEKEIQVHCKYSECKNSKENGGWFTLTFQQYQSRKDALEKDDGNDGRYLYCSEECKQECCLYYFRSDPLRLNEFEKYYKTVGGKTNLTFKKFYNEIENAGSRGKKYGYELDHKFSIYDGFINNVDPEIIAHYKNLECISELENQKKNKTSSITLEELMKMITNSKRKVK